jgi:hypothetical protein
MGLRDFRRRLTADLDEIHNERLQDRYRNLDLISIGDMPLRRPVKIGGEIQRTKMVPSDGSPTFEVTLCDGSGTAVAVFSGRTSMPGFDHGRHLVIEGVARDHRGKPVLMNPTYTIQP